MSDSEDEIIDEEEQEIGPALVKRLREKLKKAVEEKQEYLDGWQRSRADFANFKREEALIHTDKEARLKSDLIETLLPALDALELAIRHDKSNDPTLKMLERQFLDSLQKVEVVRFGKVGEQFNPHLHEALSGEGYTIKTIERSGYKTGDHIIRAAHITL